MANQEHSLKTLDSSTGPAGEEFMESMRCTGGLAVTDNYKHLDLTPTLARQFLLPSPAAMGSSWDFNSRGRGTVKRSETKLDQGSDKEESEPPAFPSYPSGLHRTYGGQYEENEAKKTKTATPDGEIIDKLEVYAKKASSFAGPTAQADGSNGGQGLIDIAQAIETYIKENPNATFGEIQIAVQSLHFLTGISALRAARIDSLTIVGIQNEIGKTCRVTFELAENPPASVTRAFKEREEETTLTKEPPIEAKREPDIDSFNVHL